MRTSWVGPSLVVWTALVFFADGTTGQLTAQPFRYPAETETNVYRVTVESTGEAGREAVSGTIVVISTNYTPDLVRVSVKGQLRPKPVPGSFMPTPGFRPGGTVTLMQLVMGPPVDLRELLIRPNGEVVRQSGDSPLPIPMGGLAASLIQRYAADSASEWRTEGEVVVADEPLLVGPIYGIQPLSGAYPMMGYHPGRPGFAMLAATQTVSWKMKGLDNEKVILEKKVRTGSMMQTGNAPRVSATGRGEVALLRESGWPESIDMEYTSVATTEMVSRKVLYNLRWERLHGQERESALRPAPTPPPGMGARTNLTQADWYELARKLREGSNSEKATTVREIAQLKVEKLEPEILSILSEQATSSDDSVRLAALDALAKFGTREQVPLLIKAMLHPGNGQARMNLAKRLGELRDPRAAQPLADLLGMGTLDSFGFHNRSTPLTEALVQIGPAAEATVLPLLREKNVETRVQACSVLKDVGTKKSLKPLLEMTLDPIKEVSEAAAEAARTIQARETDP